MKKTELEYPASHSVDTDWYAVDRDGRLANIESGPEGLLPVDIESTDNGEGIIEDAMFLNSTEIEPGCRFFPLSDRHIKRFEDNQSTDIDISESLNSYWCHNVLILGNGIKYNDLLIWKNRNRNVEPLIYVLSEDHHVIYVKYLSYSEESYRDDVENDRIKAISFLWNIIRNSVFHIIQRMNLKVQFFNVIWALLTGIHRPYLQSLSSLRAFTI